MLSSALRNGGHADNTVTPAIPSVPNPRTLNETAQFTLKEAWARAEAQFKQDTGGKNLGSPNAGKDGVLRRWKQAYTLEDLEDHQKSKDMTVLLEKILSGIELVGGVAAQAASTVFPPAGMCFNAIQFLIDAPRQIRKVYDGLKALFDEVQSFLAGFVVLKRIEDKFGLDEELVMITNNLLISFVRICGLATKLLDGGKWSSVKTGFKTVLFRDDSGVSAELEQFRRLAEGQNKLTGTVTLEQVLEVKDNMSGYGDRMSRMETQFASYGDLLSRVAAKLASDEQRSKFRKEQLTHTGSSAVDYKQKLYVFHQAYENSGQLRYNVFDDSGWAGEQYIPNVGTSCSPSTVCFQDRIYVFHQGNGYNGQLWYNTFDGQKWHGDRRVPNVGMSGSPSAVVFRDKVYVFHQGGGRNGQLWYNTFDGKKWDGDQRVPNVGMTESPSAVVFQDKLYVFHQGGGYNGELWYNTFDGRKWDGDKRNRNIGMSGSPSAIVYQNELYLFHQGYADNGEIWYTVFDESRSWLGSTLKNSLRTSWHPSAALYHGHLLVFHRAYAGSGERYYSTFNGTQWLQNQNLRHDDGTWVALSFPSAPSSTKWSGGSLGNEEPRLLTRNATF